MVCDMLCKDDESDGDKRKCDFADACPCERASGYFAIGCGTHCNLDGFADVARDKFFDSFDESKVGIIEERLEFCAYACGAVAECREVGHKGLPVDDLKIFNVASISEYGEERRNRISCADTDNKRNEASHFESLLS